MPLLRRLLIALVATLTLSGVAVALPVASGVAHAADGCGSGYDETHNRPLFAQKKETQDGRQMIAKAGTRVQFCSYGSVWNTRTGLQKNRRVRIGVPTRTFGIGQFSGSGVKKTCTSVEITVRAKNISDGTSIGVNLSGPEIGKSFTKKSRTWIYDECQTSSPFARKRIFPPRGLAFTVPGPCSFCFANPEITSVTIVAKTSMTFDLQGVSTTFHAKGQDTTSSDINRSGYTRDDTTPPVITSGSVALADPADHEAQYTLEAEDDRDVAEVQTAVNGVWGEWRDYEPEGTLVLPDSSGDYRVTHRVRDHDGNVSAPFEAGTVTRTVLTSVALRQIDNHGTLRSCGATEETSCTDVVKRFRADITSPTLPTGDLLLRGWRKINDVWVESSSSPMQRMAIGAPSVDFPLESTLLAGQWRFRVHVPRSADGSTAHAASPFQYLTISAPDSTAPAVTGASVSMADVLSRTVQFTLTASDNASAVTQMRVAVNGEWRSWVPFASSGTVVLPDGYGRFGVAFQVMDAAGNPSAESFAGVVTRMASVSAGLRQIDNQGNVRSCGSLETSACSDVVKRFRTSISSPVLPSTDLLLKAWRNIDGAWVETTTSPLQRMTITGPVIDFGLNANLLRGLWRFQTQIPRDAEGITDFAASEYQYLRIS